MDGDEVSTATMCPTTQCPSCWCPREILQDSDHVFPFRDTQEIRAELATERARLLNQDGTARDRCKDKVRLSQYTDIVYFRYRAFSLISGTIGGPPGPPAAQARRPLSRRSNWSSLLVLSSADQRGSALGTAYMFAYSVLLQKLPWSRVVQHTPSHWQNLKLETGIIEFQVAPFVTVVADI
jgi:hypothetical protein